MVAAIARWYHTRYGVDLAEDEIVTVKGSQEALSHIPLAFCDPGDLVLIPDPYYPIYGVAPKLAGADIVFLPLKEENDYLIDFDAIQEDVARKAKLMYVSYPNNPTGKTAPDSFYERLIRFAKRYDIVVLHDNAYSELVFDKEPGKSFLSFEGAKDVGIELNSFSKSYSMGGARLAVMVGNRELIAIYKKMMNMIDFQAFGAVQRGENSGSLRGQRQLSSRAAGASRRFDQRGNELRPGRDALRPVRAGAWRRRGGRSGPADSGSGIAGPDKIKTVFFR